MYLGECGELRIAEERYVSNKLVTNVPGVMKLENLVSLENNYVGE